MFIKKCLLLLLLATAGFTAKAQFNDSTHHYLRFSATGIFNKTDDNRSFLTSNALRYNLRKKLTSLNFNGNYVYGQQSKRTTNNDFSSTLDFNLFPRDSSKVYYWGLLNYDESFSLKINARVQTGLGVAYNFVDNTRRFLNVSNGILYESSNQQLTDSTNITSKIFRNSLRIRYRFALNEMVVLDGTNNLLNSLSSKDDYLIKSVNTLSVRLRKWLSLTAAVTYNRINLTSRENLLITFGLIAETYF